MGLTRSSDQGRSMSSSLSLFGRSMALVAVLLSMAAYPAQAQTAQECDANAAFDRLMSVKSTSALAEFTIFLKYHKFDAELKKLAAGKAILAPHNMDMMNKVFPKTLTLAGKKKGFKSTAWKLSDTKRAEVMTFLKTLVVDAATFRTSVKPDHPCDLVAVVRDSKLGLKGVMTNVPSVDELFANPTVTSNPCADVKRPGRGLGRKDKLPNGKPFRNNACQYKAFGRNKRDLLQTTTQCSVLPPAQTFVPVGSGYNAITGNPTTASVSASDGGLFQGSVFDFNGLDPQYAGVYCYTQGSGCSDFTTVSGAASAEASEDQMAFSIGISGSYAGDSFSANTEYEQESQSASASKALTVVAGNRYTRGTFQLNPASSNAKFTNEFFNTLANIGNAIRGGDQATINSKIGLLYKNYGTHVTTSMTIGGKAQVDIKISASSSASFNAQSISVSAEATATYGLSTGSVSADYAGYKANAVYNAGLQGSITTSQSPAQVSPPFVANTNQTDCAKWSKGIDDNTTNTGGYGYVGYKVISYDELIHGYFESSNSNLFAPLGWTKSQADAVEIAIRDYMTSCGALNGKPTIPGCSTSQTSGCSPGYYGDGQTCTNCYGKSAVGTYNPGNCPYGTPCDGSTGKCLYAGGLMGHVWANNFGTKSDFNGCDSKLNPFDIVPAVEGVSTKYCQGTKACNGGTGAGGELGTNSSPEGLWNFNYGNQDGGTWSLTGYFVPQLSGNYIFSLYGDDCAFMWLDAGSYTGALGGAHTEDNKYIKSGLSYVTGGNVSLAAYNAYPIRIQFGNKVGSTTPWGINLKVSADNGYNFYNVGGGAGSGVGGYLYHNHDTEICNKYGDLTPNGNQNQFYTCGGPGAGQGDTNSCFSTYYAKYPNCANVGF